MEALKFEYIAPEKLIPYAKNARQHPPEQVAMIMSSIKEFGFTMPILVRDDMTLIAGHGRLEAAHKLGLKQVPIVKASHLTDAQARALVHVDNQIALKSQWDFDLLKLELDDIKFDFEPYEFELPEIEDVSKEGLTDDDDVPEVEQNIHGVVIGDIWKLGEHRIMCGDSTDVLHVEKLMSNQKADMVFTDPPYNHASDDKGVAASVSKAHADLMSSEWDKNFSFLDVAGSIEIALAKDATVYVCTSWHLAGQIWDWMSERSTCSGYCVWHKPNPMPSLMKRHWTWASELICYATYGKHTFNFPKEGHASNVWTFTKKSDGSHPTQKPIELCEHAISHSSKPGNLVLDLFLGSGSTLIACEKINRKCYGMELDPHYCSVIIERWQNFTGKKAERIQ